MTLWGHIPALSLLIAASACSIQRDVPGFIYPESTLTGAEAPPVLQPTRDLIVDASQDEATYSDLAARLDWRAYRLRQQVSAAAAAPDTP